MKIDLQKAYDRLSWKFLRNVLTAFGFHQQWIHWVMRCVTSASMTLMLNGAPFRSFQPKRGIRQGDPISSYLFILCMEVLSRLINAKVAAGQICGIYLGLPLFQTGNSKDFKFLIERMENKLAGWKSRVLSKAQRNILIKSVISSIPVYAMHSMKIPVTVCSKLDSIIRKFWGAASHTQNPLCLRAWKVICQPKQ
ncbi:hypothetical protein UlMin_028693 [Ulmus minor]